MSFYSDDHPAFDTPAFNPGPPEESPVAADIEVWDGIQVERVRARMWQCFHGNRFAVLTGLEASVRCAESCGDPKYHSTHTDVWEERGET